MDIYHPENWSMQKKIYLYNKTVYIKNRTLITPSKKLLQYCQKIGIDNSSKMGSESIVT